MTSCPKCGSNSILGPVYVSGWGFGGERLQYKCFQCGYRMHTETLDAKHDRDRDIDKLLRSPK